MTRWASEPVVILVSAPAPDVPSPPIYVQDWWGAAFTFTPTVDARLTLRWGALSPDTTAIDPLKPQIEQQFSVAAGLTLQHALPHLGAYLSTFVELPSGVGQYDLQFRHSNRQERSSQLQASPLLFFDDVAPPGETRVPVPPYVGPAYAVAFSLVNDPTVAITIESTDAVTALTTKSDVLFYGAIDTYDTPREIWLPPLINEVVITNGTGSTIAEVAVGISPAYP